ncbi:hypothetical protein C8Q74DRAFT_570188 [Fomes fomentarius]|nr:hypothetical protein C8Q74DRAFT_570188 [Fomes fomentarius]
MRGGTTQFKQRLFRYWGACFPIFVARTVTRSMADDLNDHADPLAHVPIDILDQIFTLLQLEDDRRALYSCSLTSRHWREVSLRHLFHTITVLDRHSFASFFTFLRQHPEIAALVKVLKFGGERCDAFERSSPNLDCDAFASLLPTLRGLDEVYIGPQTILVNFPAVWNPYHLKTLIVDVAHYIHFKNLSAFSALSALFCLFTPHTLQFRLPSSYSDRVSPGLTFQSSDIGSLPAHSVRARRLVLGVAKESHFQYLRHILDQDSLQHVSVYCGDWANVAQLCDLVQLVGTTSIESIDVNIHPYPYLGKIDWRGAPVEDLELLGGITAPCTKLRSLRVTLPYLKDPLCSGVGSTGAAREHSREYPICRTILSRASRDLRTFSVCLMNFLGDAPHVQYLALWDLEELERPWFRERFPLIEAVVVQLSGIRSKALTSGDNPPTSHLWSPRCSRRSQACELRVYCRLYRGMEMRRAWKYYASCK